MDIHGIMVKAGLSGIQENGEGWRCSSPKRVGLGRDDNPALQVFKSGAYTDHHGGEQESGHVIELYAKCIGKSVGVGRAELIRLGLVERGFRLVQEDQTIVGDTTAKGNVIVALKAMVRPQDYDWGKVVAWRGISLDVIRGAVNLGALGYVNAWPGLGSAFMFVSTQPPSGAGESATTRSIGLRSAIFEEKKYLSVDAYPVWVSSWKKGAVRVLLMEGQWDALAMEDALLKHADADYIEKTQVIGLCQGKDIGKYPELMEYLQTREVIQVPDFDANRAGDNILMKVHEQLSGFDHKLIRVPEKMKDFNDWWRANGPNRRKVLLAAIVMPFSFQSHRMGIEELRGTRAARRFFRIGSGRQAANHDTRVLPPE